MIEPDFAAPLSAQSPLLNGRPTIALLSGAMSTRYRNEIVFGANDCALEHGYNILSFIAGVPNDPLELVRARLLKVVNPALFAGLVIPMSTVCGRMSPAEIDAFFRPYRGMPIATIGSELEGGIPIVTDNTSGMQQLLSHLIEDHGFRDIAFVCGTDNKASTREKLDTYISTLAHYGIAHRPEYIIRGPLERLAPDWFARELLDERKLKVQAIVSVNDNQAFSIIHSLQERGIRVPQDIAVTGCMNIVEGSVSSPSLTTVQEPMHALGWLATKAVIDKLEGVPIPERIIAPTQLVIRHSCGCTTAQIEARRQRREDPPADAAIVLPPATGVDALILCMQQAARSVLQSLNAPIDAEEIRMLAAQFASVPTAQAINPAMLALEEVIDRHLRDTIITAWLAIIPALQRHMLKTLSATSSPAALKTMNARFESLITMMSQKAFNYCFLVSESYIKAFRQMTLGLNQNFDLEGIRRLVVRELKATDCYISVFDDENETVPRIQSLLAIQNRQLVEIADADTMYDAALILPPCVAPYDTAYALMTFPLTFGDELIGMMTVNFFDRKGPVFENLVELTSDALKNEMQIQALKSAEEKFTDIALAASDWLWEVDAEFRYTFCSDGVEAVLGYRSDEMIGRSLFDCVLPSQTDYLELVKNHLIPAGRALESLPHLCVHKNGSEVSVLISGTPILHNHVVVGYRGAFKDMTENAAQENRIRQLAYNDPLTGLPNRALFQDRLSYLIANAQRAHQQFSLLFLDLDRFKNVNDTLGHDVGDLLLQEVATRLSHCISDADTLSRLGGDEFTVILSQIAQVGEVARIAQSLVDVLSLPMEIQGHPLFISTSIGIAVYPRDGDNATTLLKNADRAMYKAKEQGTNRYVFYDQNMSEISNRRMQIEAALRLALKNELFQLHYQPQVLTQSGRVVGLEALIRLSTPELGFISPAEFIALAEEIGLIEDIGLWVFETACKQAKIWDAAGVGQRISINVSACQLKNTQLASVFISIIQRINVSPQLIEIEITESAMIDNEGTARATLHTLSDYGCKIALDDFGTGYSSLSTLKKFPIDTLKIDRAFINDCVTSDDALSLVSAIIKIAKSLHLNIIAEGVETRAQLETLRFLDCHEIQGYLFSKPLPADKLAPILQTGVIEIPTEGR